MKYKTYIFGDTAVRYHFTDDNKVFMQLLPSGTVEKACDRYCRYEKDFQFTDAFDWYSGALVHLHLTHHSKSPYTNSCKLAGSYKDLYFKSQEEIKDNDITTIKTILASNEGYEVVHELIFQESDGAFTVETSFVNNSKKDFTLEMLSSGAIDGLSPYSDTEHSKELKIHIFKSGWATEGKHMVYSLSDLNLEKAWGGNYKSHKIGTMGARATADYFPFAAVEDEKTGVIWGMTLLINSTWQMEFSRYGRDISFTGGIGDKKFGGWSKTVKPGESFTAPKAYIAAVSGSIEDMADVMLKMRDRSIDAYGENGMYTMFNEWCTTWGNPTHEGNIALCKKLSGSKIKYFVMDDGWFCGKIGDWEPDMNKLPKGLKAYTDEIRTLGIIPGLWMELEVAAEGSEHYENDKYSHLMLKQDGTVIEGQVGLSRKEKLWDFNNPETVEYLKETVIKFIRDNGFGYLKVDYNAEYGNTCDGCENEAENFRKHLEGAADFFRLIKKEIPDIIIENCASGGMRLDPVMTGITAMSSFSDAHECFEFPIIAANLHYLLPPCQSQIWCVLKPEFDKNRFAFTISAGFLGRICWSGDFVGLTGEQMKEVIKAESFYEEVSDIIRHGKSYVYRTADDINYRYPEGTQAVLRYADTEDKALLVYHTFDKPEKLEIPIMDKWEVDRTLYPSQIMISDNITIDEIKPIFGNVVLLKKSI